MSLPADIPGQIAHVFPADRERDVLVNWARQFEDLKQLVLSQQKSKTGTKSEYKALAEKTSPWGVPIKEGADVSTVSES